MTDIKIDKIIRSDRKSYSIVIKRDGLVIVRVPNRANKKEIDSVINQKSNWILKKLQDIEKNKKQIHIRKFTTGEIFKCLDQDYELILLDDSIHAFRNDGKKLYLNKEFHKQAKQFIINWYKFKAYEYMVPKTQEFAKKLNINYNQIKISNAKTKWGSCSNLKNLNYSWRLIIAPPQVVDYVIVHELSHLLEMNHSKRFWNVVSSIKPNYQIYKTWLKDNGHLLDI